VSVCLLLKFSTAANVLTLAFKANNSKHDAHSRVKNTGFSYRLSQSDLFIEDNCILSGIPDRCVSHEAMHYISLPRFQEFLIYREFLKCFNKLQIAFFASKQRNLFIYTYLTEMSGFECYLKNTFKLSYVKLY